MNDSATVVVATSITCYSCGQLFGVPEDTRRRWYKTGETCYCPACGKTLLLGPSEVDTLRKRLEDATKEVAILEQQLHLAKRRRDAYHRQATVQKGVITKLRKRLDAWTHEPHKEKGSE